MPEWLKFLLSFVIGAAGSFFAPWAHWGIEKRKIRLQQRLDVLKRFKSYFNEFGLGVLEDRPSEYAQLKDHLSKSLTTELEAANKNQSQSEYLELKQRLVREIVMLEKKWGLF